MWEKKIVNRLSILGFSANLFLVTAKIYAGIIGNSSVMISDGIHSMADILATLIAFLGCKFALKEADRQHPYGYDRTQHIGCILLGIILFVTGIGIGMGGLQDILGGELSENIAISPLPLLIAGISIGIKGFLFFYTKYYAKLIHSDSFMAEAWHQLSDVLSSTGALIGVVGTMIGMPILEPLACIVICGFIIKTAIGILAEAVENILDTAWEEEKEDVLREKILEQEGVYQIDILRTRKFGYKIYVDLEIGVNGDLTLFQAHEIAVEIRKKIAELFPEINYMMIHENPKIHNFEKAHENQKDNIINED